MIIVTGASGGIGRKILKDISKIDKVIGIYNSNKPNFKFISSKCKIYRINLLNENEIREFTKKYLQKEKKISLVHLASLKKESLLINQNIDDMKKDFDLNFFSAAYFSKLLIPMMAKNNWGRFIFFSSTGGEKGDVGTASYTSTKMATLGLSRVISLEYSKFNITSNIIRLGNFNTGMYKKLSVSKKKELINQIPSKKLGDFKDIVSTISLIIKSNYINGAEINIDGAMLK